MEWDDGPAEDHYADDAFYVRGQWKVVGAGLYGYPTDAETSPYQIAAEDLLQPAGEAGEALYAWPLWVSQKTWVDLEDFLAAYHMACRIHSPKLGGVYDRATFERSAGAARKYREDTPSIAEARAGSPASAGP